MRRKKIIYAVLSLSLLLSGCSLTTTTEIDENGNEVVVTDTGPKYSSKLENGMYYVRNGKTDECVPVYFGEGTFDQYSTVSNPNNGRIMWFKEDFNNIPTLYEGDSLIMYTTSELSEKFLFERFEYLGYSIGLCGMSTTPSNRYSVSTSVSSRCTYPNGDTDVLLQLTNENVVIDKIGGQSIRAMKKSDDAYSYLTRCGTIKGLKENNKYSVEIYDGTIKHEYVFTADVICLGSMEVTQTNDFEYESDTIINIKIPEYFNSGYYMLNGYGMFRYVKGTSYDKSTDFNIPNEKNTDDASNVTSLEDLEYNSEDYEGMTEDTYVSTFEVISGGSLTVKVDFTINSNITDGDGIPDVSAVIISPSGNRVMPMIYGDEGLELSFTATEIGVYTIKYYNLSIRTPHVTIE